MDDKYRKLIDEVLELPNYDMKQIARELRTAMPTILRIYHGETKKPRPDLASAIFRLHIYARPDLWGLESEWCLKLTLKDSLESEEGNRSEQNEHISLVDESNLSFLEENVLD